MLFLQIKTAVLYEKIITQASVLIGISTRLFNSGQKDSV